MPRGHPEFEKAIAGDRNFAAAYGNLGWYKFLTGAIEEVIPLEERAIRLSPLSPFVSTLYSRIGLVHLLQSRTDEAITWLKEALLPARPTEMLRGVHAGLASAYALKGDTEQAASELAAARGPENHPLHIALMKARCERSHEPPPSMCVLLDRTLFDGLRKAGVPE